MVMVLMPFLVQGSLGMRRHFLLWYSLGLVGVILRLILLTPHYLRDRHEMRGGLNVTVTCSKVCAFSPTWLGLILADPRNL